MQKLASQHDTIEEERTTRVDWPFSFITTRNPYIGKFLTISHLLYE